ncbi:MAG: peptide deformylase [Lysinibacillus fusiformis]|uniref:peptide deformylase n=1 Tax=Lysinibacillus fusiformis TaxID=28031 RepID=UPI0005028E9C|nr:peptide deformylase [Lysinibacillus fusiformis]KGA82938.1 peptide deformylase [Lysinibacillus fusiformis]MCT6816349.1 peptide deformylase [Lysinibacillus fusiformis]MCT6928421.1 peptide deformylase [Lysinibacillus fusiformis]MCT6933470.1 peptide deformylase [Lysinibacillus fusiformis]WEA40410.1 peptide deformylase [Lysinibacillus fusiformis]
MAKFHPDYMITMKDFVKEHSVLLRKQTQDVAIPVPLEDRHILLSMLQYLKNSQDPILIKKYKLRPGSGLSANQIGVDKRMFAVFFEDHDQKHEMMFINPKVMSHSINMIYLPEGEGCLSVNRPVHGFVPRYERIKVKAYNIDGQEFMLSLKGYESIVVQHEIDHLNGIMFYDRINKDNPFELPKNVIIESLY